MQTIANCPICGDTINLSDPINGVQLGHCKKCNPNGPVISVRVATKKKKNEDE